MARAWQPAARVIHRSTPAEHDRVFAAVSHLPHLLAFALVDDIASKPHADQLFQYAASGFRDFTRIAGALARDVARHRAGQPAALLGELDAYRAQLTRLRASLAAGDGAALEARLRQRPARAPRLDRSDRGGRAAARPDTAE